MSVCRSSHFLPFMVVMSVSFVTCSLHGAGAAGKFRVSRRAKNRWLVAMTMIQNPSVIASRRGTNTDSGWDNTVNSSAVGGADYSAKDAKVASHDVRTVEPDTFVIFWKSPFIWNTCSYLAAQPVGSIIWMAAYLSTSRNFR